MVDEKYLEEERGRRLSAIPILKMLKKLKTNGKLLDIGCATGFLLDEAKKQGWDVYGVELSQWAVDYSKDKLGLKNVFAGTLKKANFANNYFDVVILKDTIEHLTNPKDTLIEIRRILKPAGIICVNTPNINSLLSRALRAKWWGLKHAHLYYFTPKTLYKILDLAGFVSIKSRSHARTFTLSYWLEKISSYNTELYKIFSFLKKISLINKKLVCINLGDQIEVFARKSRKLKYLDEMEAPRSTTRKKEMKVVAVLPAYNAAATIRKTVEDIPKDIVDEIILVDDASHDNTVETAKKLGLKVFLHPKNKGYGANQKTCYTKALEAGADIIVMVHPDYQYDPKVIPLLIAPIQKDEADAVFGSRMMKGGALEGGMPLWKHNANIMLSALENIILGTYLTEYHSGFRAYSAKYLKTVNFMLNSDAFIFDTEIIVQGLVKYMRIEEVPIRTRYFDEASSIKFLPSVIYGVGILKTLFKYILHRKGIISFKQFK
jgi:SAM-dependent methyltransferase